MSRPTGTFGVSNVGCAPVCIVRRRSTIYPKGGFTLLELLVVVIVLTVISSMVVPVYARSLRGIQVRNAQNNLVKLILYLQERAVADSREYRLYLDESTDSYWAAQRVPTQEGDVRRRGGRFEEHKEFAPITGELGQPTPLPEGLRFGRLKGQSDYMQNATYIGFYPNGACDVADIQLVEQFGRRRPIHIQTTGTMGKVEVKVPR